eukprot:520024-Prorocentrum_minimum.AAC.1
MPCSDFLRSACIQDGPIRRRKRGQILTTDQSDAGSTGIFSRRTNRTQEARVDSHVDLLRRVLVGPLVVVAVAVDVAGLFLDDTSQKSLLGGEHNPAIGGAPPVLHNVGGTLVAVVAVVPGGGQFTS